METILEFRGDHYFLSNFYEAPFVYNRIRFKTVEAAFQAAKCMSPEDRLGFAGLGPGQAKCKGRQVPLRGDWEDVKDGIMMDLVRAKFTQNKDLKAALLATGDAELIEGNDWHDNYWGRCLCPKCKDKPARNQLGRTLMHLRDELREGAEENPTAFESDSSKTETK